jgi:hypothetical protein
MAKGKKKPNPSDYSAMTGAEWLDDDNLDKLSHELRKHVVDRGKPAQ